MRPFRVLRRALLLLFLSLGATLLLAVAASQVEQHIFRRRAELLLSQIQSLELRKTTWREAQERLKDWGANQEFSERCDTLPCSFQVTTNDVVYGFAERRNLFTKLDDYFRWRLGLSYDTGPFVHIEHSLLRTYVRIGGHPAKAIADVGTRGGTVWEKGFWVTLETYGHPSGWSGIDRIEFALMASVTSRARLDHYRFSPIDYQLMLHPYYVIGTNPCTFCVTGWVNFTPYASSENVRRLMTLDLSCLSSWHHCLTQNDIMPAAWSQYLAEQPILNGSDGKVPCSPSFLEIVGRDSASIADVEIVRFHDSVDERGYHSGSADARLREWLKGATDWKVGETRKVSIRAGNDRENLNLPSGAEVFLFRHRLPREGSWVASVPPCPISFINEDNLRAVRRGIEQDYSAANSPK